MRRILVTGGAGFIGSSFVRYWAARHPADRLVVLDALTYAGSRENLRGVDGPGGLRFVHGDIVDGGLVARLFSEESFDTVVHFAAESHVDRSIDGPEDFVRTNVVGTQVLLDAARTAWRNGSVPEAEVRFHHISTDEVYGSLGPDDPPFTERTPYDPSSPYSASKAAADHLVRAYHRTYGLPITISNCSNNYGPRQYPEKLIPVVLRAALEGRRIPVYGDGSNVRDWLYVDDHCDAIERILDDGRPGRTYNVGGRCEVSNLELVRRICGILDEVTGGGPHADLIEFVTDRPGHDFRYGIDTSRIADELGWQPTVALEDGLRETVRWFMDHGFEREPTDHRDERVPQYR